MKKKIKYVLLAFAAISIFGLLMLAYGYLIEPNRLLIHEEDLKISNWNANLNGFNIVAISDIHAGSNFINEKKLRKIVEIANAQNPDLIVLLGDYISEQWGNKKALRMPVATIAENLQGFRAKYGVYAIIGNHDHWYNEAEITRELERAGIRVLDNEIVPLRVGNETVNLWGIEDYWKRSKVPTDELEKIEPKENIIAITHNPDALKQTPDVISLMLAGHTHGGQLRFPLYGPIIYVSEPKLTAGFVEFDGKDIFVTTGVGCTGPQIRFGVPPEIVVLKLYSRTE